MLRGWPVRLVVASVIAMIAISLIAVLDHRHKNAVLYRLNDAPWYCANKHLRCDEAREAASTERRWNAREAGYKSSLAVIGTVSALLVGAALYRNRVMQDKDPLRR